MLPRTASGRALVATWPEGAPYGQYMLVLLRCCAAKRISIHCRSTGPALIPTYVI